MSAGTSTGLPNRSGLGAALSRASRPLLWACALAAAAPAAAQEKTPAAGESAPAQPGGDPEAKARSLSTDAEGRALTPAIGALLKSVKADGPLKPGAEARAELVALLPGARPGEECPEAPVAAEQAAGLKDRGDGALLAVQIDSCKGAQVMLFAPGAPVRVSRLLALEQGEQLQGALALGLGGKKREEDLALLVGVPPHRTSLRLFSRRASAFAFSEAGVLRDFAEAGDCSAGGEVAAGFSSYVKLDKAQLLVLRVDASCGPAPWAARCERWNTGGAGLEHAGVCALPPRLDAKSLRAAGWK